jgi:hypothetical protein
VVMAASCNGENMAKGKCVAGWRKYQSAKSMKVIMKSNNVGIISGGRNGIEEG